MGLALKVARATERVARVTPRVTRVTPRVTRVTTERVGDKVGASPERC